MNFKKTIIVAIIFAAVVAAYVWDQRRLKDVETEKAAAARLVSPARDELTALTIRRPSGAVTLEKRDGSWMLTEPVQARAAENTVNGILGQLDAAKVEEPFKPEAGKLADFGLTSPTVTVDVRAAGKDYAATVELGRETPAKGQFYAKVGGRDEVFMVPAALRTELTREVEALRDKRLVPGNVNNAAAIELQYGDDRIAAAKRDDQWQLTEPFAAQADPEAVTSVLRELNNAQAKDFLDTGTQNLAALGLVSPAWRGQITIVDSATTPTTKTFELLIADRPSTEATTVFARYPGDQYVMSIDAALLDKIRPEAAQLRSKDLFTLTAEEVGRWMIGVQGNPLYLERDENDLWRLVAEPDLPLDQSTVNRKLAELLRLRAQRLLTPATAPTDDIMGFLSPTLLTRVATKDGRTTESLMTGRATEGNNAVYARRIESDQTLELDFTAPGQFFITRDDLLDRKLLDFDPQAVGKIELKAGDQRWELTRGGGGWQAASGNQTRQVPADQVSMLLFGANGLQRQRRLDERLENERTVIQTRSLREPPREVRLLAADGDELARIGLGNETGQTTYVRVGEGRFYELSSATAGAFNGALDGLLEMLREQPQ